MMYYRCRSQLKHLSIVTQSNVVLRPHHHHHLLRPSVAVSSSSLDDLRRYQSTSSIQKPYHLQSTRIPTFHFQKSLPRLPIPELKDTLARYQAAVEPIVSTEEFQDTVGAIEEFGAKGGMGEQVHAALKARDDANPDTSYINQWWLDMYVENRLPLVINSNPQIRLRDDPNEAKNTQLQRTTSLIASSLRFYCTLRDGALKPDVYHMKPQKTQDNWVFDTVCRLLPESLSYYGAYAMKAYPLDMSQYQHLFRSTRVPLPGRDTLTLGPVDTRHIVLQRGKDFYALDVLEEDKKEKGGMLVPISDERLGHAVEWILAQPLSTSSDSSSSKDKDMIPGVGYFTTLDRESWAATRTNLKASCSSNQASLETIDSALFLVCLEHTSPNSTVDLNRCFLHGDGENRWFDKSFQLIVAANGKAAVNFEHSWGDGVAVLRYLNEVYQDSIKHPVVQSLDLSKDKGETVVPDEWFPRSLSWNLSKTDISTLEQAKETMDVWVERLLVTDVEMDYTREHFAKELKIGIDGVLQMCIQLAHYRLHGNFVSTYESASTSAFKHGRTETVRSCTRAGVAFVEAMSNPHATLAEKETRLREAIQVHNELTKNGVLGQGCDRHLFALRKIWEETHEETSSLPKLFSLPSAEKMNHIILSTSTLSSPYLEGGGFGPVNDDCYGVGYGMEEKTVFQLATYRRDAAAFNACLSQSLEDIHAILIENLKAKKTPS